MAARRHAGDSGTQIGVHSVDPWHHQRGGEYWAVPFNTNGGLLFDNKSKIHTPPATWQQAYQMAKSSGGIGYQGQSYEGWTVDFLEMLSSVGGSVLSPDGMKATIGSPQAPQVLKFMQQGLKDGAAPQANPTYMEEESRNAFQIGKVLLLRNWPYVYALAEQAHVNFGVEPLRSGRAASQRVCWAATTWGSRPLRRSRRLMRLTLPGRSGPNVRPEMTCVCG